MFNFNWNRIYDNIKLIITNLLTYYLLLEMKHMKHNFLVNIALVLLIPIILIGCRPKSVQTVTTVNPNVTNQVIDSPKPEDKNDLQKNIKPADLSTNSTETAKGKVFTPTVQSTLTGLDTQKIEWSWAYSPKSSAALLSKYHGYAFGDTSQKNIYLTFDEGYEFGYTSSILDTLKANNVKAAFFITAPYVTGSFNGIKNIDLIKRMENEGHIIGNHSVHHKSMPSFKDESAFDSELTGVESAVANIPGLKISKFFRPPMGDFSELSLYYTQRLSYKTIFFSLAYYDYDVKNQPDPEKSKSFLLKSTKPGMICLLHAESKTNATILDNLLKEWKSEGYTFRTLNELP
jgi:peptidoglycan-N-acetylmuramic acid deacetylase